MSELTTAEKLAAAKCEAAPWGWSDHDSEGVEIVACEVDTYPQGRPDNPQFGFAAIIRSGGVSIGKSYRPNGKPCDDIGGHLVPLPAPTPEPEGPFNDLPPSTSYLKMLLGRCYNMTVDGNQQIMNFDLHSLLGAAAELVDARKTIEEQAAALAAKEGEAERHAKEIIEDQRRRLAEYDQGCREQSDTIQRLANERDELNRCVDLQCDEIDRCSRAIAKQEAQLKNAADTIQRQAKRCVEIVAERDAAIDLATKMRWAREAIHWPSLCADFDRAYGERTAAAPFDRCPEPAKCSHEWRHDEDLGYRQKCCDRCGKIETLCSGCDEVPVECRCGPLPTCEPLPAPDFRKFPFDRDGWYYRWGDESDIAVSIEQIDTAGTWRRSDGVLMVRLDGGWVSVDDLRTWQRSADGINWEACPNG